MSIQKCPLCKKKYNDIDSLANHIERKHLNEIPEGWTGGKYIFYSKHGRTTGKCIVCGKETEFNESTMKPNRLCGNPNCAHQLREQARNNMMKKYGKETLLNDPEFQKKMLDNRSISKDYKWSDGSIKRVVGNYEYDAVRFLDLFMNFDSNDVIVPAPMVINYKYEGENKFYIPDIYIPSLNLIIEIKDGGDNPNMHPKIQAVDKVKEKLKEDAVRKERKYNYVKITNKQYSVFIKTLLELKGREIQQSSTFVPLIITNEMTNNLLENMKFTNENNKIKDNINLNEKIKDETIENKLDNIIMDSFGLLTEDEINKIDFPIKGYKFIIEDKNDFLLLKEKLIRNNIPEMFKHQVENYIYQNESKYIKEDDVVLIDEEAANNLNRDLSTLNYKNKYISDIINECKEYDELTIIKYEIDNNVTDINDKLLLENVLNIKSQELKHNNIIEDDYDIVRAIRENNIEYLNKLKDKKLYNAVKYICIYEKCRIKTGINIDNEILDEIGMNLKPSIQLSLDPDGNILIKRHENVDFMSIYSNSHMLLKEYEKVNNIDGIKYELCKLFYMKTLLDNNFIYSTKNKHFKAEEKKEKALKTKAFIMNDFKYYLRFILSQDNTFNFNDYFSKTQFGIEIYKLDNRLFKLLNSLKKIIL